MGSSGRINWEPVFSSEDEGEARIVVGLLEGHEIDVKLAGDPGKPYMPQPAIKGMAGRYGAFLVYVSDKDSGRAQDLIRDYMEERTEEAQD